MAEPTQDTPLDLDTSSIIELGRMLVPDSPAREDEVLAPELAHQSHRCPTQSRELLSQPLKRPQILR